jgi:hypothetical protein
MPVKIAALPRRSVLSAALPLLLVLLFAAPRNAFALPSYSKQTGMPCSQCHTVAFGPQLTPYGRQFKLNGYVWGNGESHIPLALMTVLGQTHTSADLGEAPDHFDTNNNFAMNELTGFLAGRLAPHLGAFVEAAYSGTERKFAWGAFDVRSAWSGTLHGLGYVAGVTLNNNPTVTDLWNSTPVWSFPYTGSDLAPTPAASPLLYDGISERVLGPSFYVMLNNHYYVELGAYKGMGGSMLKKVGVDSGENLHMSGITPYWRAVAQYDVGAHDFSVGLVGLNSKLRPDNSLSGKDSYNDIGLDGTYQFSTGPHALTANLSLVHEKRRLHNSFEAEVSDAVSNKLNSKRFDATYAFQQTWSGSLGLFSTTGTSNSGLFAPADTGGSANGSPDSSGYTVQLEYVPWGKQSSPAAPWMNARFGLQYTGYHRFNGGRSDYDGSGRSASDNNTLFLFAWFAL